MITGGELITRILRAHGVGTVFSLQASGHRSDWKTGCVDGKDGLICPAGSEETWRSDNRSSLVADIGWIVGVGGVGGGVANAIGGRASNRSLRASASPTSCASPRTRARPPTRVELHLCSPAVALARRRKPRAESAPG